MVLLDNVVQVLHASQLAIRGQDSLLNGSSECLRVGGMLISADGEREAAVLGPHQLLKEAFCRGNVPPGAEHELDGVSRRVNCAIKVLPFCPDLDVRLI